MSFEEYWADIGQRGLCFTAEDWARHGWLGHQMHGDGPVGGPLDAEVSLLEDRKYED